MSDLIDTIGYFKQADPFDFRPYACPEDPLRHRFDEWVDYYNTKHALGRALHPASVLEIGVRYGYGAISFLTACPTARYLGLDDDSATYGGSRGALAWARQITRAYAAEVRVADTQTLRALPGGPWDLVHVDGQQDGDGTFHDLELAIERARWILLDGYFFSRVNLLSATFFLEKYRSLITAAYVLPGYAGDLLVRVEERGPGRARDDASLRAAYDREYYGQRCAGHEEFKRAGGREILDPPRRSLYCLARPDPGTRVLDVGCGRGEFAFACFAAGAEVVGVDYSEAAIAIAADAFRVEIGPRLQFVRADVADYQPSHPFDVVAMADFVEHVAADHLDAIIARCQTWLTADGHLLIHTWPNRQVYEYQHRKRRRAAAAAGLYLPKSPRTYDEDRLHVNEQTPARLRRLLQRHFTHVRVWTADWDDAQGALRPGITRRDLARFESIYAVASMAQVDGQFVLDALAQPALDPEGLAGVRVDLLSVAAEARPGGGVDARVRVINQSRYRLASFGPFPVRCSYHWMRGDHCVVFDGLRTAFWPPVAAGQTREMAIQILAPSEPGLYELVVTLVQEGQFWFDAVVPTCRATTSLAVG